MEVIKTAYKGGNSDLIKEVCKLYLKNGDVVYDVTYGKGVFWKKVDLSSYDFKGSDLMGGVDFSSLPYSDDSCNVLVLDPPYMHGGASVKDSINKCYRNKNTSHESVIRLYAKGILEASRVLVKGGLIWVKCQDEIESGKQRLSHCEIISLLEIFGFSIVDIFLLVSNSTPTMRNNYQNTARKNHSYLLIAKFRR